MCLLVLCTVLAWSVCQYFYQVPSRAAIIARNYYIYEMLSHLRCKALYALHQFWNNAHIAQAPLKKEVV